MGTVSRPSRRVFLKAAGSVTAIAALPATAYIAGSPAFDDKIEFFNPDNLRAGKTIAFVLSGNARRNVEGMFLLKKGLVDHLAILGQEKDSVYMLKIKLRKKGYDQKSTVIEDTPNTMQECEAVIAFLKKGHYQNAVIVTDGWHTQRCNALIKAIQQSGIHISFYTYGTRNQPGVRERLKLGLTRISQATGLPFSGIRGVQIPGF